MKLLEGRKKLIERSKAGRREIAFRGNEREENVDKEKISNDLCRSFYILYNNSWSFKVPGGPSVACSTAKAIEWDASWSDPTKHDQSGRFVDTHDSATV